MPELSAVQTIFDYKMRNLDWLFSQFKNNFQWKMGKQIYLSLFILGVILAHEIGALSDEKTSKW